ncbi:polysaccharide deacetylase family protein [Paenibacillus thailandensis]|uniref:Polysaccharide deacetylase family protein n=1 Tax=Paenibacillus thailandensis TaxID=393250 RepID=A0ABW5R193_9BACL
MIRMGKTFLCAVLLSAAVSIGEGHGLAKVERAQGEGAEAAAGQAYAAAGHSFPLLKFADGAGGNGRLSGGQAGEAQTAGRSGRTAELEKAALSGDRSGEEQRGGTSGERAGAAQPDKPGKQPVEQPERTVYLTFDDGPGKHTPEVLDVLQAAGVKGTFFMLGKYVELHPDIVRRIVKEGHGVGNHTYDHVYDKLYGGFDAFAEQVLATEDAIYAAAGVRTELVRAPGGTFGNFDEGYFSGDGRSRLPAARLERRQRRFEGQGGNRRGNYGEYQSFAAEGQAGRIAS